MSTIFLSIFIAFVPLVILLLPNFFIARHLHTAVKQVAVTPGNNGLHYYSLTSAILFVIIPSALIISLIWKGDVDPVVSIQLILILCVGIYSTSASISYRRLMKKMKRQESGK